MGVTDKEQTKWFVLALLAVILISIIIVQVKPESSKATPRIDTMDSGFTEETSLIEAIIISGSGESCIIVGGKLAHEGDIINGFRILKIYPDRVEFEKNGKIVVGTINTQTSTRPKSNDLLQQQVSSEQAHYKDTHYRQYRQPTYNKQPIAESRPHFPTTPVDSGKTYTDTKTGQWQVFETTIINGLVKRIRKGTILKTTSGNIYEVANFVFLFEMEVRPDVTILTDGQFYMLFIQGVDEPLLCKKLNRRNRDTYSGSDVIETTSGKTYLFTGGGHWVNKIIDSGNFVKLEDNSLWQVNPIDRINCSLWLYTEDITVVESQNPYYPYLLINIDDGEKVEAKLISD